MEESETAELFRFQASAREGAWQRTLLRPCHALNLYTRTPIDQIWQPASPDEKLQARDQNRLSRLSHAIALCVMALIRVDGDILTPNPFMNLPAGYS
eukprot:scaffold75565_cov21-Prasinocladus_malaysianus.AAC.1